jgi:hypothetical protein
LTVNQHPRYPINSLLKRAHSDLQRFDKVDSMSSLDTQYRLNSRLTSSIKSAESVVVFGTETPLELSLDLFRVLMVFADKTTTRKAFQTLDVDTDIDDFAQIISNFLERGLLEREESSDEERGLPQRLNPKILSDPALVAKIGSWIRQGRAVIIPDALPEDLAEQVHNDLDRSIGWTPREGGYGFAHYRNCVIEALEGRTPALSECSRLFKSASTRRFVGELSGEDCAGDAGVAAAWYRPGEYALPHDDTVAEAPRSVSYIWYLTKDWRKEWGGTLFWCPSGQYVSPRFNTLAIFKAVPSNIHFVCPVAPSATAKRLTIHGFWHRSKQVSSAPVISPIPAVSPRVYGQHLKDEPDVNPVVVL